MVPAVMVVDRWRGSLGRLDVVAERTTSFRRELHRASTRPRLLLRSRFARAPLILTFTSGLPDSKAHRGGSTAAGAPWRAGRSGSVEQALAAVHARMRSARRAGPRGGRAARRRGLALMPLLETRPGCRARARARSRRHRDLELDVGGRARRRRRRGANRDPLRRRRGVERAPGLESGRWSRRGAEDAVRHDLAVLRRRAPGATAPCAALRRCAAVEAHTDSEYVGELRPATVAASKCRASPPSSPTSRRPRRRSRRCRSTPVAPLSPGSTRSSRACRHRRRAAGVAACRSVEHGSGEPLVLLHGGFGAERDVRSRSCPRLSARPARHRRRPAGPRRARRTPAGRCAPSRWPTTSRR